MLVNRIYYRKPRPAISWNMRAAATPLIVRRAMGKNLSLVVKARRKAKQETIYDRGLKPKGRFTNKLLNGDKTFVGGNVFGVRCDVKSKRGFKYAQVRNDMTGYSKRLKMRKESNFAGIAEKETRAQRSRNIREAMREVNAIKG